MIAAALAAVEGKRGRVETGGAGGRRSGIEFANQFPGPGVNGGIGTRRAREWRLVHQHEIRDFAVARDRTDVRRVLRQLMTAGLQALVDDMVQQGGLARARDAAEADQPPERK